jgi:hypothetical protein
MKRSLGLVVAIPVACALAVAPQVAWSGDDGGHHGDRGHGKTLLEWDVMAGVTEPFTGADHPVRGVAGGGAPWEIDRGTGELSASGKLRIRVKGLVLARRAPVPPERQGTNPVALFRGAVNCLTPAAPDLGETVFTAPFPASPEGDARIRARVTLPEVCVAPVVFVTNGTAEPGPGAWFAVTGR